jgi:MraZ protein
VEVDRFHSTYVNKIDRKGRVSVPADFRAQLGRGGSNKVVLYPAVHFMAVEGAGVSYIDEVNRQIEALPPFSQERDDLIDVLLPSIQELTIDSEGRVVLPENLIAYAKLSDTATFIGRGQNFQIWSPEGFAERQAEARARVLAQRQNGARP